MLLHDYKAPSPRRVRIYLAEKGLTISTRTVDLAKSEQLAPAYRAKNPRCTVPMLELDDGTCIWDTLAICEYLETLHPEVPMFGRNPVEHADEACAHAGEVCREAAAAGAIVDHRGRCALDAQTGEAGAH